MMNQVNGQKTKNTKKKTTDEEDIVVHQDGEVSVVETTSGGSSVWYIGLGALAIGGVAAAAGGGGSNGSYTPTPPSGISQWSSIGGWGEIDVLASLNMLGSFDYEDVGSASSDMTWGLSRANFNDAHTYGYTGQGVVIAIIDSGLDLSNLDLTHNLSEYSYNFIDKTTDVSDDDGHGTKVSSIIFANDDGVGLTGGAYSAQLMSLKVLDSEGKGLLSDIIDAIYYAVDNGANIINLSLGGDVGDDFSDIIPALQYADDNNVLVVIAAGNESHYMPTPPASYAIDSDSILAVGALREYQGGVKMPSYSNEAGEDTPYGYVLAAGSGSKVYDKDGNIVLASGTSMSAPHVTAQAAILLSADPTLSDEQLVQLITSSASSIFV